MKLRVHGTGLVVSGGGISVDFKAFRSEEAVHGYFAHEKQPPPLGPPQDPRHRPTVGS